MPTCVLGQRNVLIISSFYVEPVRPPHTQHTNTKAAKTTTKTSKVCY